MDNQAIDLKQRINLPTGTFLLLTIATVGVYAYHWLLKNTPLLEAASRKQITTEAYLVTAIGLLGWGGAFAGADASAAMAGLGALGVLAGAIMLIVWAFKAKDALRAYAAQAYGIDYQMNSFYTFIFGYFYINYCINEIPEEQARLHAYVQRSANP